MTFDEVNEVKSSINAYVNTIDQTKLKGNMKEFIEVFDELENIEWVKKRLK